MVARKGEMKPMDAWERSIKDSAVLYSVVMFQPGVSSRVYQTFEMLDDAIKYSTTVLQEENRIRSAMIYAIDEHNHHALVGTINRHNLQFKEVVEKTY